MIYIGIDTGTHTGFAVWDSRQKKFRTVETMMIHQAIEQVKMWSVIAGKENTSIHIFVEDARQRKWYSGDSNAKQQGAGSVKRDASIWEDFLKDYGYDFTMVAPQKGLTKMTPEYFKKITGWKERTSNHARDAALLVMGRR